MLYVVSIEFEKDQQNIAEQTLHDIATRLRTIRIKT